MEKERLSQRGRRVGRGNVPEEVILHVMVWILSVPQKAQEVKVWSPKQCSEKGPSGSD
jgi:hypothetical protein